MQPSEPRRILVAAPTQFGRTKVGNNLASAFARQGHDVRVFDYDQRPWHLAMVPKPFRNQRYAEHLAALANQSLLRLVDDFRPDLFLCVKGLNISAETIRAIASRGALTAGYWIDDPLDHARALLAGSAFDIYFTNDRGSVSRYTDEGFRRIYHLPSSADPEIFFPIPESTRIHDLTFIGTHSAWRESILSRLQDFDLRVHGPGWKRSSLRKDCIFPEAFGTQTNLLFNRTRINLNIHNWFGKGTAMNLRLFEVPAAGAFLLTDWVEEIDGSYVDGEHLVCWRTVDELRERISCYLQNDVARERIALAGREHFLGNHSYERRAAFILEKAFGQ
jgi:spore maturation protein CgeB